MERTRVTPQSVELRRANERGESSNDWLRSRFSFSFADYFDPDHMSFGPLRVINEDWVLPATGFDTHPHRDMEIVTVVLEGAVEHRDSTGGQGILRAGEVQAMTAGTGVAHSEKNPSKDETLHLLQIWIVPDRRGLEPGYSQKKFFGGSAESGDDAGTTGSLVPVASGRGEPGALRIHQDATICFGRLDAAHPVTREVAPGRRAYVHVIDGEATVAGQRLATGDAAKFVDPARVDISAETEARVLFFDLP